MCLCDLEMESEVNKAQRFAKSHKELLHRQENVESIQLLYNTWLRGITKKLNLLNMCKQVLGTVCSEMSDEGDRLGGSGYIRP